MNILLRTTFTLALATATLTLLSPAVAELHDRGGGLIYDDVLDVTWLQDTAHHVTTIAPNVNAIGKMTWTDAMNWVSSLVYHDTVRNVDWDDWRLPNILPLNGTAYDISSSFAGLTDNGYNITSPASELSYMYHVNLGGVSLFDTSGNFQPGVVGIADPTPFTGLNGATWSQNEKPDDPARIFIVGMGNGHQDFFEKTVAQSPWAVRDGDVAIPPDGDLNDDGQVDIADVLLGFRILAGGLSLTTEQSLHADVAPLVNGLPVPDGVFNSGDYLVILRKSIGLVSFP
jgi:hypothetical protein